MERRSIVERTRAEPDVARQLGRNGARKPKMTDSAIGSAKELLASGVPPKDVTQYLGRHRAYAVPPGVSPSASLVYDFPPF